jgi:site-specific DNA-methyltransferase (adenine-specific)
VADAKLLRSEAPELADKVMANTLSLPQAKRELGRREKSVAMEAKAKEARAVLAKAGSKSPWNVIKGDYLDVAKTLTPGTFQLVFADPKYNQKVNYGSYCDDGMSREAYLDWSRSWIEATVPLLMPDGAMWVLISDEWADEIGCLLRKAGLHRRSWIRWRETFGVNTSRNFTRCSRHLFYMVKDKSSFVFNDDAVNRRSDRQDKYGDSRADPGGKIWDDVWGINPEIPRLVDNSPERVPGFPTQLPLGLLKPIVGCASDPGDLILDPFSGSGTTGHAALLLGRQYAGVEINPEYVKLSRDRLIRVEAEIHARSNN